jgi:hypothetical protein
MSGTVGSLLPGAALNILPVTQDMLPGLKEGSKICSLNVNWAFVISSLPRIPNQVFAGLINLLQQAQTGNFSTIQSVWIDNSTCPYPVTLVALETTQQIVVPAFHQGMYPIFANTSPVFSLTLNYTLDANFAFTIGGIGTVPSTTQYTTRLIFLNTPQRYFQKSAEVSAPFSWTGEIVVTATSTPAFFTGQFGNGVRSNAPNFHRIRTINMQISALSPLAADAIGICQLIMQGAGIQPYANFQWSGITGAINLFPSQNFEWPHGVFPSDTPSSSQPFQFNWGLNEAIAIPGAGYAAVCTVSGDLVTIQ